MSAKQKKRTESSSSNKNPTLQSQNQEWTTDTSTSNIESSPSNLKPEMNDIDQLFTHKKETMKKRRMDQIQEQEQMVEEDERIRKARREDKVQGPSQGGSRSKHPVKKSDLSYTRDDTTKIQKGEWASDGLGGIFDADGWTGRTESGMKIYKHHLFNKKNAGKTKDCPFDCDCCYI